MTSKDIQLWQGIDQNTNKHRGYDKRAGERCSNDASVYEACSDSRRRCFEYRHKEARVPRRATRGVLVRQRQSDRAIIYRGRKEQNKYWATPRGQTGLSERRVDKSRPEHNVWQLIRDHNQAKMAAPQVRVWLLASLSADVLIVVDRWRGSVSKTSSHCQWKLTDEKKLIWFRYLTGTHSAVL